MSVENSWGCMHFELVKIHAFQTFLVFVDKVCLILELNVTLGNLILFHQWHAHIVRNSYRRSAADDSEE
jgi:hypothetical protein